nr:hypothetical protein [Mucilaginibacter sp. X4EP1]
MSDMVTIKTFDHFLHFYPKNTKTEVIEFLTRNGMILVSRMPVNMYEFQLV